MVPAFGSLCYRPDTIYNRYSSSASFSLTWLEATGQIYCYSRECCRSRAYPWARTQEQWVWVTIFVWGVNIAAFEPDATAWLAINSSQAITITRSIFINRSKYLCSQYCPRTSNYGACINTDRESGREGEYIRAQEERFVGEHEEYK